MTGRREPPAQVGPRAPGPVTDAGRHGAPALAVRSVGVTFGSTRVLAGVDLDVPHGQVTALVGPSGCGKTTLVRAIAGFERVDVGTVELAGRAVAVGGPEGPALHVAPERRRIGVVPQEGALFTHLDVAANVGFGLRRGGKTAEGRSRVDELLELVDLAGLGSRRPDQLSGGQQQRVAVARALAPRPELVLLDEPFSALDATLRVAVRDAVMAAVRAERASALLVTHDQDEALSVADTVAVLLGGRIAQVGSPAQVYSRPVSAAVAAFLGEAVLLRGDAAGGVVRCALGTLRLAAPAQGAVTVLARPEDLALRPAAAGGPGPRATVTSVSFHGHDALVGLVLPDGTPLRARVPGSAAPGTPDVTIEVRGPVWPLPA